MTDLLGWRTLFGVRSPTRGDVIMGMSAETFWDGAEGTEALQAKIVDRAGELPVIMGSTAVHAALEAYGGIPDKMDGFGALLRDH